MRILITGGSGFIGAALGERLREAGHEVVTLGRDASADFQWNPIDGQIDSKAFDGVEAVIHLAGENVGKGQWSAAKKRRILESRELGTRLLCEAAAKAKPRVIVTASGVGFYGNCVDEVLGESSPPGNDFLAEVCQCWEAACEPSVTAGIRVVNLRLGIVLSPTGGALKEMLLPFRLGLGGRLSRGKQWMSWITLADVIRVIERVLDDNSLSGPINAVAGAVTNVDFTRALAGVVRRPAWFPVPAFVLRAIFGEKAEALFLSSARVEPGVLRECGFEFRDADLAAALTGMLKP